MSLPSEPDTAAIRWEWAHYADMEGIGRLCDALDARQADNARLRWEIGRIELDFEVAYAAATRAQRQRDDARGRLAEIRALCDAPTAGGYRAAAGYNEALTRVRAILDRDA